MAMHSFIPKENHPDICTSCSRHATDHSDKAECDSCGAIGRHEMLINKVLCTDCYNTAKEERDKVHTVASHNKVNGNITGIGDIQVKQEFFNSKATSLTEARIRMLQNGKTEYDFCKWMETQLVTAKDRLIALRKEEEQVASEISAMHVQFNQLADKLTKEQRDSLALKDINYKPQPVKITTPKVGKPSGMTSEIKAELKRAAEECGAPIEVLRTFMNMRKLTVKQAVDAFLEIKAKHQ